MADDDLSGAAWVELVTDKLSNDADFQAFVADLARGIRPPPDTKGGLEGRLAMSQRGWLKGMVAESMRRAQMLDALWDIAWHTAGTVRMRIGGTHVNYHLIEIGEYEFRPDNDGEVDRLMAWAELLRHREANAPLPEPPPLGAE